jgi:hypothetical protein
VTAIIELQLVSPSQAALLPPRIDIPSLVAFEGERAATRYVEFFTAQIRNPNTRAAYARAAGRFLGWCKIMGPSLPRIGPVHVAAYVEQLGRTMSPPRRAVATLTQRAGPGPGPRPWKRRRR